MDVEVPSWDEFEEARSASIVEGLVTSSGQLKLKNAGGTEFNAGLVIKSPKIDVVANGIPWAKPDGAKLIHVMCIGGGGAGAAAANGYSGGGGGGGGFNEAWINPTALGPTIACNIGYGANPALGPLDGSQSFFGSFVRASGGKGCMAIAPGGTPGEGGHQLGTAGNIYGGHGSSPKNADTGAVGAIPTPASALRGGGGGGHGAFAATNVARQAGGGGYAGDNAMIGGENGSSGTDVSSAYLAGSGGSGGITQVAAPYALAGAAGGAYGGGGGGGAYVTNGAGGGIKLGAGGSGAQGLVLVVTYF